MAGNVPEQSNAALRSHREAAVATSWCLADSGRIVKPLVLKQQREPLKLRVLPVLNNRCSEATSTCSCAQQRNSCVDDMVDAVNTLFLCGGARRCKSQNYPRQTSKGLCLHQRLEVGVSSITEKLKSSSAQEICTL